MIRRSRRRSGGAVPVIPAVWIASGVVQDNVSILSETKEDLVIGDNSIDWTVTLTDSNYSNGTAGTLYARLYKSTDYINWTLCGSRSTTASTGTSKSASTTLSGQSIEEGMYYRLVYDFILPPYYALTTHPGGTFTNESKDGLALGDAVIGISGTYFNSGKEMFEPITVRANLLANGSIVGYQDKEGMNGDPFSWLVPISPGIQNNTKYQFSIVLVL